jgi:hypothetical protein
VHVVTLLNLWSWHHKHSLKATKSLNYEKNAGRRADLERSRARHDEIANGVADQIEKMLR